MKQLTWALFHADIWTLFGTEVQKGTNHNKYLIYSAL